MIRVTTTYRGLFALARGGGGRRGGLAKLVNGIAASAQLRAVSEYATGQLPGGGIKARFGAGAFATYGFQPRSKRYRKKQIRVLGSVQAYVGPWSRDYAKLAILIVKRRDPLTLITALQRIVKTAHMRDLVTKPGTGHTFQQNRSSSRAVTTLRWPGARVLNAGGAKTAIYRDQFRDLTMGGSRDANLIKARTNELFLQSLPRELRLVQAVRVVA